jgi:hypothetical protein
LAAAGTGLVDKDNPAEAEHGQKKATTNKTKRQAGKYTEMAQLGSSMDCA